MSYSVSDFNPANPTLLLKGLNIEISKVTLQKEVILIERYGSLQKVYAAINEDKTQVINVLWELVVNKEQLNNSVQVFTKKIIDEDEFPDLMGALNDAIKRSRPLIKNEKRYKEIMEVKKSTSSSEPCYAKYYDAIAKRYGYDIEKFYNLTLGQIHMLLNTIGDESYKELEVQAALQGRKLEPRMEYKDVSVEEEAEQEAQAQEAVKELQRRYKEGLNNGK